MFPKGKQSWGKSILWPNTKLYGSGGLRPKTNPMVKWKTCEVTQRTAAPTRTATKAQICVQLPTSSKSDCWETLSSSWWSWKNDSLAASNREALRDQKIKKCCFLWITQYYDEVLNRTCNTQFSLAQGHGLRSHSWSWRTLQKALKPSY